MQELSFKKTTVPFVTGKAIRAEPSLTALQQAIVDLAPNTDDCIELEGEYTDSQLLKFIGPAKLWLQDKHGSYTDESHRARREARKEPDRFQWQSSYPKYTVVRTTLATVPRQRGETTRYSGVRFYVKYSRFYKKALDAGLTPEKA